MDWPSAIFASIMVLSISTCNMYNTTQDYKHNEAAMEMNANVVVKISKTDCGYNVWTTQWALDCLGDTEMDSVVLDVLEMYKNL